MSVSRELTLWAARVRLVRKAAVTLAVAAVASAIGTYAALRGLPPFGEHRPDMDQLFLLLDLVLVLPLCAIVVWRVVQVWTERRRGLAGSRQRGTEPWTEPLRCGAPGQCPRELS